MYQLLRLCKVVSCRSPRFQVPVRRPVVGEFLVKEIPALESVKAEALRPVCRLDIISLAAEITDKVHFILPLFPNATVIRIADGHYSDIHIIATCSQFIVYDVFCQMRLFNPLRYKIPFDFP